MMRTRVLIENGGRSSSRGESERGIGEVGTGKYRPLATPFCGRLARGKEGR